MKKNESQNNDNQTEQTDQLTDLEPSNEVKGGTLSKVGLGTLVLTNDNTYMGQTTVNGNLQIADLTSATLDPL